MRDMAYRHNEGEEILLILCCSSWCGEEPKKLGANPGRSRSRLLGSRHHTDYTAMVNWDSEPSKCVTICNSHRIEALGRSWGLVKDASLRKSLCKPRWHEHHRGSSCASSDLNLHYALVHLPFSGTGWSRGTVNTSISTAGYACVTTPPSRRGSARAHLWLVLCVITRYCKASQLGAL